MEESVERIVQAYLKTKMTVKQFEDLVRQELAAAAQTGSAGDRYDEGYSDGWDACLAENGLEQP